MSKNRLVRLTLVLWIVHSAVLLHVNPASAQRYLGKIYEISKFEPRGVIRGETDQVLNKHSGFDTWSLSKQGTKFERNHQVYQAGNTLTTIKFFGYRQGGLLLAADNAFLSDSTVATGNSGVMYEVKPGYLKKTAFLSFVLARGSLLVDSISRRIMFRTERFDANGLSTKYVITVEPAGGNAFLYVEDGHVNIYDNKGVFQFVAKRGDVVESRQPGEIRLREGGEQVALNVAVRAREVWGLADIESESAFRNPGTYIAGFAMLGVLTFLAGKAFLGHGSRPGGAVVVQYP